MNRKGLNRVLTSLSHAADGFSNAFRTQGNMRIHVGVAFIVLIAGLLLGANALETAILVLAIAMVICAELANTAIEGIIDIISPQESEQAKKLKDVAAASVLVAAIGSVMVGVAVFGYKLLAIGKRFLGTLLLVAVFLAAGSLSGTPVAAAASVEMHFIDVGQGDAILIRTLEGGAVLVDGGELQAGSNVVVPYLRKQGIERLDCVVVTHPHSDHVGGLVPVLKEFDVGRVLADGQVHTSGIYVEFLETVEERGITFSIARAGDRFTVPGIDQLVVLNPSDPLAGSLNDNSLVLRLEIGQVSFVLAGDIEHGAFSRLENTSLPLKADVLKVPHHGGWESGFERFVELVNPRFAIISCGAGNSYGHPDPRTLAALEKARTKLMRTDVEGNIIIKSDGSKVWLGSGCGRLVNINTATFEQLKALPGIGEVLAGRIVKYRKTNRFDSIQEITEVKGIGDKRFEAIQHLVCVE